MSKRTRRVLIACIVLFVAVAGASAAAAASDDGGSTSDGDAASSTQVCATHPNVEYGPLPMITTEYVGCAEVDPDERRACYKDIRKSERGYDGPVDSTVTDDNPEPRNEYCAEAGV